MPTRSPKTTTKSLEPFWAFLFPQFCSFHYELDEVLGTRDAMTLPSIVETGSTNQNTSASTDLSSFVNSNKLNLCLDDKNSKEENDNKKRGKRSKKTENIEGLVEMNIRMVRESKERQQKFLESLSNNNKKPSSLNERKTGHFF